jgi:deoxyribodipyrimidine photo-lyase
MNTNKKISMSVWLKRDLRLQDNEAISMQQKTGIPTLLLYVFEKSLENDTHYSANIGIFQTIYCRFKQAIRKI